MMPNGMRRVVWAAGILLAAVTVSAFSAQAKKKPKAPITDVEDGRLGSLANPVKCDQDLGEYDYLSKLRGPDGKRVKSEWKAEVPSKGNKQQLDKYLVESKDGSLRVWVYMSRHYPGRNETRPVPGFTIKD